MARPSKKAHAPGKHSTGVTSKNSLLGNTPAPGPSKRRQLKKITDPSQIPKVILPSVNRNRSSQDQNGKRDEFQSAVGNPSSDIDNDEHIILTRPTTPIDDKTKAKLDKMEEFLASVKVILPVAGPSSAPSANTADNDDLEDYKSDDESVEIIINRATPLEQRDPYRAKMEETMELRNEEKPLTSYISPSPVDRVTDKLISKFDNVTLSSILEEEKLACNAPTSTTTDHARQPADVNNDFVQDGRFEHSVLLPVAASHSPLRHPNVFDYYVQNSSTLESANPQASADVGMDIYDAPGNTFTAPTSAPLLAPQPSWDPPAVTFDNSRDALSDFKIPTTQILSFQLQQPTQAVEMDVNMEMDGVSATRESDRLASNAPTASISTGAYNRPMAPPGVPPSQNPFGGSGSSPGDDKLFKPITFSKAAQEPLWQPPKWLPGFLPQPAALPQPVDGLRALQQEVLHCSQVQLQAQQHQYAQMQQQFHQHSEQYTQVKDLMAQVLASHAAPSAPVYLPMATSTPSIFDTSRSAAPVPRPSTLDIYSQPEWNARTSSAATRLPRNPFMYSILPRMTRPASLVNASYEEVPVTLPGCPKQRVYRQIPTRARMRSHQVGGPIAPAPATAHKREYDADDEAEEEKSRPRSIKRRRSSDDDTVAGSSSHRWSRKFFQKHSTRTCPDMFKSFVRGLRKALR